MNAVPVACESIPGMCGGRGHSLFESFQVRISLDLPWGIGYNGGPSGRMDDSPSPRMVNYG